MEATAGGRGEGGEERGYRRLLAALHEAGYVVLRERGDFPKHLELEARTRPRRMRVELRLLRSGGHGAGEVSMRMRPPRRASEERLVLGYSREFEVFVGWPRKVPRRRTSALWVPRRTLAEASKRGIATAGQRSGATAFAPERVGDYLELYAQPSFAVAMGVIGHAKRMILPDSIEQPPFSSPSKAPGRRKARSQGATKRGRRVKLPSPRERKVVESGFASVDAPAVPLDNHSYLTPGGGYLYWFAIGAGFEGSIEEAPVSLPSNLPEHAKLEVKLFPFPGELQLEGPTRAELEVQPDGSAVVTQPAAEVGPLEVRLRVLFFAIRTLKRSGLQRLRCNLYYGSTLLQSRLVTCRVGRAKRTDPEAPALLSEVDYALSPQVDLEALSHVPGHDLSLMVNGGGPVGERTHQFRFFQGGGERFEADASLEEGKVAAGIRHLRNALRKASWNSEEELKPQNRNRYPDVPGDEKRFAEDLIRMARRGHDFYLEVTGRISSGEKSREELEAATRRPCRIQIARAKEGLYLPAALFYDHPLETAPSAADEKKFKLCEAFSSSLQDRSAAVEDSPCVMGECPNHSDVFVVCPSGFWGFRHEIGWPASGKSEPLTEVPVDDRPEMVIGVSTDEKLELREKHVKKVLELGVGEVARSREQVGELLASASPHLIYFYCHGGVTKPMSVPFLEFGPRGSSGLNRAFLQAQKIRWDEPPRPVVFINGCRTTALDPETLSSLVAAFVEDAEALGVVGTEVTIFESLACAFAEAVLGRFLDGSMSIGEAIRRARFDLLRDLNPLGLVYVPFIAADTRLVKKPA